MQTLHSHCKYKLTMGVHSVSDSCLCDCMCMCAFTSAHRMHVQCTCKIHSGILRVCRLLLRKYLSEIEYVDPGYIHVYTVYVCAYMMHMYVQVSALNMSVHLVVA